MTKVSKIKGHTWVWLEISKVIYMFTIFCGWSIVLLLKIPYFFTLKSKHFILLIQEKVFRESFYNGIKENKSLVTWISNTVVCIVLPKNDKVKSDSKLLSQSAHWIATFDGFPPDFGSHTKPLTWTHSGKVRVLTVQFFYVS